MHGKVHRTDGREWDGDDDETRLGVTCEVARKALLSSLNASFACNSQPCAGLSLQEVHSQHHGITSRLDEGHCPCRCLCFGIVQNLPENDTPQKSSGICGSAWLRACTEEKTEVVLLWCRHLGGKLPSQKAVPLPRAPATELHRIRPDIHLIRSRDVEADYHRSGKRRSDP